MTLGKYKALSYILFILGKQVTLSMSNVEIVCGSKCLMTEKIQPNSSCEF